MLEETYEVLEAIHSGDREHFKEELGDLLLQIVLNAQVAKDCGDFDIQDVAKTINEKMIKRHPHVFANVQVGSAKDVIKQWADLKDEERGSQSKSAPKSAMDGVPSTLPALLHALKISERAVGQGFEWRNEAEVWDKLFSELTELKEAICHPDMQHRERMAGAKREVELELGDVLFTLVNIGRWHSLNAEEALILAIEKFKTRYRKMEEFSDKPLKQLNFDDLDQLWERAKTSLRNQTSRTD